MRKKFLLSFALFGLGLASAKSYTVNLYQTAQLGNMELKPGEYRIEVADRKVVIRNGAMHGEAPVKVENAGSKYPGTSVRLTGTGTSQRIEEIRIGGTTTRLKFE